MWLLVQKSRFEEQVFRIELILQEERVRVNMMGLKSAPASGPKVDKTEIWDLKAGEILNIDHAKKTFYVTPVKDDQNQIIGEFGGRYAPFGLKPTTSKKKVGSLTCSEYDVIVADEAFGRVCYTQEAPKGLVKTYAAVGQKIEKFRGPSVISQVDLRKEGFLLSYVDEDNAVTEIESIQETTVDPGMFSVPADYVKTQPASRREEEEQPSDSPLGE